jgi:hypothetical protein
MFNRHLSRMDMCSVEPSSTALPVDSIHPVPASKRGSEREILSSCSDMRHDGVDGDALFEQERCVILPDGVRLSRFEPAPDMASEMVDDAHVATISAGVLAADELVVKSPQQLGHRKRLL